MEEDEAGRLAGFRARFGRSFDAGKDTGAGEDTTVHTTQEPDNPATDKKARAQKSKEPTDDDLDAMFAEEDDAQMLEMISNFGKVDKGSSAQIARKKI